MDISALTPQLSSLYDFSLFIKLHRSITGYRLKEVASYLKLDSSKLNRIENNKIPHSIDFEKNYLKYFKIDINDFIECDRFYTNLYYEVMDKVVFMDLHDLLKITEEKINQFKLSNSIPCPLEQLILFICLRFNTDKKTKKLVKRENEFCDFIRKNSSFFNLSVIKYFYVFYAFKLSREGKEKEAFNLIYYTEKHYPSESNFDCILYGSLLIISNRNTLKYPAAEYYYKGKDLCIQSGALKRLVHLGINYASYLRNIESYDEALRIDLYSLKIIKQLTNSKHLLNTLLYNIGLDYMLLQDFNSAYQSFYKSLKYWQDGDTYFHILFILYKLDHRDRFENLYLQSLKIENINSYNQNMIQYVLERYNGEHKKCEEILNHMLENEYPKLVIQDKKFFLKYVEEFYESIGKKELALKYTRLEQSLEENTYKVI